ncbi:MAG: TonB-dependent receptor, partial [Pseudomonadota bacterium]
RATGDREPQADSISYGAAFLFEPNDAFDALVSVDIFNDDSFGTPTYNLTLPVNPQDDGPLGVPNFFLSGEGNFCDLTIDGAALGILPPGEALNGCAATSIDIATADDFRTHIREFPFRNFIDGVNVSAEINIDVGRFTLTSVTGYRESDEQLFEENLGAPLITGFAVPIPAPIFTAQRIQEYEQFSEELRIAGDLTDNITIVGGAYYLHTDFSLVGSNGPLGGLFGPVSEGTAFLGGLPISNSQTGQKLDAYAAFFDGTWQITDRFSFSGGARVTYEEKEFNISFLPCAGCATFGETTASDDWLQPTGRGIFQYQFTPDVMGFAGWSRGFRSGGFNGRAASLEGANRSYDPETVDNFEGGFRTEWLNNTVRINPTFFYTRYKDQQSPVIRAAADGSGTTETLTENVGRSRIWGIELEGLAQPTPELTFRLAAGYLNAEITEFLTLDTSLIDPSSPNFDPTATADDLPVVNVTEGRSVLRAPEFTVSVGGDYVKPIFDGNMQFTLSANYSWKDEFTTSPIIDLAGGRRDLIPSDGQADFSVTLETLNESGGNLSLTGYVKDAFHDGPGALGTTLEAGVFYFGAGRPTKVYGLEAVVTFN